MGKLHLIRVFDSATRVTVEGKWLCKATVEHEYGPPISAWGFTAKRALWRLRAKALQQGFPDAAIVVLFTEVDFPEETDHMWRVLSSNRKYFGGPGE